MKGKLAHLVPVTADLRSLVYDACTKQQGQFLFSHNSGESAMRLSEKMKEKLDAEMLNVLRELAVERVQLWRDAEHFAEFANRRRRQDVRLGLARFHFALIEKLSAQQSVELRRDIAKEAALRRLRVNELLTIWVRD